MSKHSSAQPCTAARSGFLTASCLLLHLSVLSPAVLYRLRAESWSCSLLPVSAVWFLVCCHAERDARCGLHGPKLLSALDGAMKELEEGGAGVGATGGGDVALMECSHLNGHRYAAIAVAVDSHRWNTQWYGCVRPEHAPLLLSLHTNTEAASSDEQQSAAQHWLARHKR